MFAIFVSRGRAMERERDVFTFMPRAREAKMANIPPPR
jgi:hypothetical protein